MHKTWQTPVWNAPFSRHKGEKWVHCLLLFYLVLGKCYCHITVSFLCSLGDLDTFYSKIVILPIFEKTCFKRCSFEKKGYFRPMLLKFLVTRETIQQFLRYIFHLHKCTFLAHPFDFFALTNFAKLRIFHTRFLFGTTSGVDSYHFAQFWGDRLIK